VRTVISSLELVQPRTLRDALAVLRQDDTVMPLAGCTDIYVALQFGTLPATRFLDLWGLRELRRIEMRDDILSIGALATYRDLMKSAELRGRLPILAAAAREIGGVQIHNRGTIGGNIANASPAGDTLPVLAAAEATIVLRSIDGSRRVPFASFFTGYRQTVRRPDELIIAVEIPPVDGAQWFRKVGTRAAQAISKVVMAGIRARNPRLAFGSVAPIPVRVPATEAALAQSGSIEEATRVLMREITPIDDLRSSAEYRRRVAANLMAQFWRETR